MKCIQKNLGTLKPYYQIESLCVPDKTLFIDIETTGLYAKSSGLYMIGCAYYDDGKCCWQLIQWFAVNYKDEKNVLRAFADFAADYRYLIHFNGNRFDIPYIKAKLSRYDIPFDMDEFENIDIYRMISPYKTFLKLPDCKQKTIETFLNISRDDIYNGGELISVYHEYVRTRDEQKEHLLLLHNEEDLIGMFKITSALTICDLFRKPVIVTRVEADDYQDINHDILTEIIMSLELPSPLPVEISYGVNGCYFSGTGSSAKLRVPLYEEEMKYFYPDHRDYYYLPEEDAAIHKSVAGFVDKEYRVQASAHNCYTKKISSYLPQWDHIFSPVFRRSYDDKQLFFELTDDFKTNREAFCRYAHHILEMMA